jgi:hypothetical protein
MGFRNQQTSLGGPHLVWYRKNPGWCLFLPSREGTTKSLSILITKTIILIKFTILINKKYIDELWFFYMDLDNLNKICNILQKHWNCQKRLHDLAKTSWSFTGSSDRKMTIGYWSRWYQSYSLLRSYSILFIQKSPTVPAGNFLKFIPLPSTLSDGRGSRISHMKSTGDRFNIKKSCPTFCQQLCICFFPLNKPHFSCKCFQYSPPPIFATVLVHGENKVYVTL